LLWLFTTIGIGCRELFINGKATGGSAAVLLQGTDGKTNCSVKLKNL